MDGGAALGGPSGGARKEGDVAGLSLLLCNCDFWRLLCLPETVGDCGTGALVPRTCPGLQRSGSPTPESGGLGLVRALHPLIATLKVRHEAGGDPTLVTRHTGHLVAHSAG